MEEDIKIIKESYVISTEHKLDENNKRLKQAIENVLDKLDKKDKVIDLMAKHIGEYGLVCGNCINVECIGKKQKNCIKKYFYKKVEEEK